MIGKIRFSGRTTGDKDWSAILRAGDHDELVAAAQEIADHENADFTIETIEV